MSDQREGERRSEFEGLDYLESQRSEVEFRKDLETLLLEYLRKPSRYTAYMSDGRLVDGDGNGLVEMCERANKKSEGTVRHQRVMAETDGLRGLETLYGSATEDDVMILPMPPGTREERFGDTTMTNISVLGEMVGERRSVITYTIPTMFLPPQDQIELLGRATTGIDENEVEVAKSTYEYQRDDQVMASSPIRVRGGVSKGVLEKLSTELGFEGYEGLMREVEYALEMRDDIEAEGRRQGLLLYVGAQIVSYREARSRESLLALAETVRHLFALEAAGQFAGMGAFALIEVFKKSMKGFVRKHQLDKVSNPATNMIVYKDDEDIKSLRQLHLWIQGNSAAQEMLQASSCGGGGWQEAFTGIGGEYMSNLANPNTVIDTLNKTNSEKDYKFDKTGECVVCHEHSDKVGKLGPCHICKGCDHKIRQQVE